MRNINPNLLNKNSKIRDAMNILSSSPKYQLVSVIDNDYNLVGVISDYDIRQAFLKGADLDTEVNQVMNKNPFTLPYNISDEELKTQFKKNHKSCIPLIDEYGKLKKLAWYYDFFPEKINKDNRVVFMAGGKGKRLMPLTQHEPKPMLKIGDKPILEILIMHLRRQGFHKFIIILNHLREQIIDYFKNGEKWNVSIEYINEDKKLGTAGGLSLIEKEIKEPLIVMNADLLTSIDCNALLEYHKTKGAKTTICVKEYNIKIPYGVIIEKDGCMDEINEKPVQRFFVNAGIYVFEPDTLRLLEKGETMDMPEFLKKIKGIYDNSVVCFPLVEYWIDIGRLEDYEQAKKDYPNIFNR